MHELFKKAKGVWAKAAAAGLALLVLGGAAATPAAAMCVKTKETTAEKTLIPVGHTVGIKLFSKGVLVVKLAEGDTPAKACGLEKGDLIVRCNGAVVNSSEQFQALVQDAREEPICLQVERDAQTLTLTAEPSESENGTRTIGAWIRDSMAGIGTMTFYDPDTGVFGALGHGITDVDTAQLMPFASGSILPSAVKAVKKGQPGAAGELRGEFDLTCDLGHLYANTTSGVFGTAKEMEKSLEGCTAVPVATAEQIKAGPAVILANVAGDEVQEYQIEISKVYKNSTEGRNLLLTVTDPRLLAHTGGIVQGMSGSPILQNGRIVGAVTHVLLNDPTKGYGIFIENMLDAAK